MQTATVTLSVDDVFQLHSKLVEEQQGQRGVRHQGRLLEAVLFPLEFGNVMHDDLYTLAALYVKGLTTIRPFEWGNARLTWHIAHLFLGLNGISFSDTAYEGLIDRLAASDSIEAIAAYIEQHCS